MTEQEQSLFPEEELLLLTIDRPEVRKRYTAESLERNEVKRAAICRALAEGHGLLKIAKAFGVSHHLVSRLRDSRPELVAIEKKQLSRNIGDVLAMLSESYKEAASLGKIPVGQIPVAFGIFSDKKASLDGDPGMVIEHRHTIAGGTAEDFEARLAKMRSASTDIASGGNGEKCQQKEISAPIDVVADAVQGTPGDGSFAGDPVERMGNGAADLGQEAGGGDVRPGLGGDTTMG